MNQLQHIHRIMEINKVEAMRLLRWTELDYCEFQEKMGRRYLQSYIPHSPEYIDHMLESKIFWNWWKMQWVQRDEEFNNDGTVLYADIDYRRVRYEITHDPERLLDERFPTGIVMQEGYALMIAELNKNLTL